MKVFLILALPIIELWLMIKVGTHIGALTTIGLLFFSVMLGLSLLQRQGMSTLLNLNQKTAAGERPEAIALEGMILAASGILFIFPGFITDAMGFICLLPFVRRRIAKRWLKNFNTIHSAHFTAQGRSTAPHNEHQTIDGEYHEVKPDDKRLS